MALIVALRMVYRPTATKAATKRWTTLICEASSGASILNSVSEVVLASMPRRIRATSVVRFTEGDVAASMPSRDAIGSNIICAMTMHLSLIHI